MRHLLPYCVLISKPHFLVNFIVPPSSNTAPIVDGRYGSKYHFFSHVYNHQVLHYILIIFPRRQKFRLYVYDWCHFLRCSMQHVASCAVRTLACLKHRRPKVIFRTRRTRNHEEKREWLILNISPSMSQQLIPSVSR